MPAVGWGVLTSLAVRGYQFGRGNHHVYLLEPLRINDPSLLAGDWWTTQTSQYHVVFNHVAALALRLGVERPVFLIGHLLTAVALHAAWLRIARRLGGGVGTYVGSVLLYHLMLGGYGLGFYAFLQDASFLPSNVAAVAVLWGVAFWIERRDLPAALCGALAGAWHLNYGLAAVGAWAVYVVAMILKPRVERSDAPERAPAGSRSGASLRSALGFRVLLLPVIALPTALNLLPVLLADQGSRLDTATFVELYAKLRHPHHYDPLSWPLALWASFLLPVAAAGVCYVRGRRSAARDRAAAVTLATLVVLLIAFLIAGVWWVHPAAVQLSLWRLSVVPKLLTCVACVLGLRAAVRDHLPFHLTVCGGFVLVYIGGFFIVRAQPDAVDLLRRFGLQAVLGLPAIPEAEATTVASLGSAAVAGAWFLKKPARYGLIRRTPTLGTLLPGMVLLVLLVMNQLLDRIEVASAPRPDSDVVALARWAREHTPREAVFLVPPGDASFRLEGRRAVVVNFKHVPQLGSELPEWHRRLTDVLGGSVEVGGNLTDRKAELDTAYRARELGDLRAVAARYGAGYVVAPSGADGAVATSGMWSVYPVP